MEKSKPAHQLSSAQPASSSLPHSAAQFSGPVRDLPPSRSGPSRTGLLHQRTSHSLRTRGPANPRVPRSLPSPRRTRPPLTSAGPHVRVPFLPRHPLRAAPASISPRSPASFPCWPARRDLRLCLFNHPRRTRSPISHAIAAPNPNTPRPPLPPEQSRCSTAATPHHPAPTLANRLRGFALTPRSTPSLCS